jgi:CBS domain-containing protein
MELVRDWMSCKVIIVTPETTLPAVEQLMVSKTIRRVPVVDNGRLVGIVTYGDIRNARPSAISSLNIWELNYLITRIKMSEIMTRDPITVSPETTIGEAAQKMLANMISGLPVLDSQGYLVGIITESDIFRLAARTWQEQEAVEPYAQYG